MTWPAPSAWPRTRTGPAASSGDVGRCWHGYNRSGLVIAHTLVRRGHPVEEAIRLIRSRRSPWALHNDLFVEYLR